MSWQAHPDLLSHAARQRFASLDQIFALAGERISHSPHNDVIRITLEGQRYYVKRYRSSYKDGIWQRLLTLLTSPRSQREWENLQHFQSWGIPTPPLVAYGGSFGAALKYRGALVLQEQPHTIDMANLARQQKSLSPEWVAAVSTQLAKITRTLHAHGFAHNDLKWRNVLVEEGAIPQLYLIDCPNGRFWWRPFLRYRVIKDLACLDKLAKRHLRRTQRLRFYLEYAKTSRLNNSDKKLLRDVLAFFAGRE